MTKSVGSPAIVFDCGGFSVKVGYAGDYEPTIQIPTTGPMVKVDPSNFEDKRMKPKFGTSFCAPIKNRQIENYDDMIMFFDDVYADQLKCHPEQHPVLITDSPFNSEENREKTLEVFMETFNVPSFCQCFTSSLSLYNAGLTSGIVIDSGEYSTDIIPVYECFTLTHLMHRLDIGGRQISDYLNKLLNQQGTFLPENQEMDILKEIKEQLCFVRGNPDPSDDDIKEFLSSGGLQLKIGSPRYQCVECLFDPSKISIEMDGVSKLGARVIEKCDDNIRDVLSGNILLTRGNTLFKGFVDRVEKGLLIHNNSSSKTSVNAPANRRIAAWAGGSILSSLETFKDLSISKQEYNENGHQILHLKTY